MKNAALLLTGLTAHAAIATSHAQAPTPAAVPPAENHGIGLSLNSSSSEVGKSPFNSGPTRYNELSSSAFEFGLSQFIPCDHVSSFVASLEYSRIDLKFEPGENRPLPLPRRLQSLSLGFNAERPINDRWSAMLGTTLISATAGPGEFQSKSFGVELLATATYQSSPTLSFLGGVAYSSLSDTIQVFPVLGLNWTPSPRWIVTIGIPETGVTYRFSDSLSLGLVATGEGGAYYVETDPLPGTAGQPDLARTTLDYFSVGVALKAEWQANNRLGLNASVGTVGYREFNYESRRLKLKSDDCSLTCELGATVAF
jgi:hypothetical protein